jgi:molybdate transport system substrate-binding protein
MVLNARSIVYPDPLGGGFAGAQVARMLERLGVADAAKRKTILKYGYEGGVAAVAGGEAETGFFNISEILPVNGAKLVGPLPPSLQSYITFSAALHARSGSPEPAMALLTFLSDPRFREFWTMGGFETAAR